jgi:tetratricopeptide (TPR) repeat protein
VVNYAEFSFDGRRLVTASDDQTARVWDASSGEAVTGPLEHTGEVNQASFSRDGRRLVTASRDRTARVWDASTGRPLSPPLKHNDSVQWAAFSPNGRWVATASDDGAARVWTVENWEPVSQPMNHRRGVVHVSFSPDAHRIVTTCTDGSVRVWNADMGEPVTLALPVDGLRAEFTAGGRQVTIAGPLFSSYLWELPWDGRPAGDLALLADALSAQRVDASGGTVAIETRAVCAAWERLRTRYPEDFASSAEGDEAWHRREVEACELSLQWAGAIPHLEHLLSARPSDRELHLRRARAYAEQGLWALAGDEYDWCLNHGETGVAAWRSRALVRLAAGDDLGYRDTLKHLLSRFGTADDPQTAAALAWICVTVPGSVPEVEQVVLLAERTEARGITGQRGRSALGAALLRKGEYAGAIQQIQRVIDPQTGGGGTAWDWLFLSMAHQGLGGSIEAATWLRKADRWIDQQVQGVPEAGEARGFGLSWEERLELGLLRREAESRLQPGRS